MLGGLGPERDQRGVSRRVAHRDRRTVHGLKVLYDELPRRERATDESWSETVRQGKEDPRAFDLSRKGWMGGERAGDDRDCRAQRGQGTSGS